MDWMDWIGWKAAKLMRRWWCSSCGFSKSRDIPYITNPKMRKTRGGGEHGKEGEGRVRREEKTP